MSSHNVLDKYQLTITKIVILCVPKCFHQFYCFIIECRKELSAAEVASILEEGRFFVASRLMKEERYEEAIEAFKPLHSPYASFNQALVRNVL